MYAFLSYIHTPSADLLRSNQASTTRGRRYATGQVSSRQPVLDEQLVQPTRLPLLREELREARCRLSSMRRGYTDDETRHTHTNKHIQIQERDVLLHLPANVLSRRVGKQNTSPCVANAIFVFYTCIEKDDRVRTSKVHPDAFLLRGL